MKNFYIFVILIALTSCSGNNNKVEDIEEIEENFEQQHIVTASPKEEILIAALLPLSGDNKQLGNNVANALIMAESERKMPNVEIKILDSNTSYSKEEWAQNLNGVDAVLGPIFSNQTQEIYSTLQNYNLPIFSLSNDHALLGKQNLFVMGDMHEDTLTPTVRYLEANEFDSIIALFPNNDLGNFLANYFKKLSEIHNLPLTETIIYNSLDDYAYHSVSIKRSLHQRINDLEIDEILNYVFADDESDEIPESLPEKGHYYKHKVAVISTESANNFSMFLRQFDLVAEADDISPTFINLKNCDGIKKYVLKGLNTMCATAKFNDLNKFDNRYKSLFSEPPLRVAEIAYDTLNFIGDYHNRFPLKSVDVLIYKGINGRFFLEDNGKNTRQYILN